jgi:2,4-dienoyl-CoA reductase-like NADH-dependent reductase (Old Yellow Enzyme family)/thioredoxin reductase
VSTATYERLFEPMEINGHTLANRVVWLPHLTGYAQHHKVSDRHVRYYAERARAGVATIIMGCETVNPRYANGLRVNAFDPASVEGYRVLSDAVHEHGTVLIGQLVDDGSQNVCDVDLDWAYEYAPSAVADWAVGRIPKVMEAEDFAFSLQSWVRCVRNHVDGGYDGSELKIAHDGLLRQFLSPLSNVRQDEYGGDRARRERFPREVLEAMRAEAGPGHILGVRFVFEEFAPGGFDQEEGLAILRDIASWGLVDYITSDLGIHTALRFCNPPMSTPAGFAREAVRAANAAVDLPVVAYGRIRTPEMAEDILARGDADLIGMARALITDPEWVLKAREGRGHRIRRCVGCNQGCLDRLWYGQETTCILNPAAGREAEFGAGTLLQAATPLRVLVVGGGPAGMKTAEVAARRGHEVTLVDRAPQLGGSVTTLSRAPSRRDFFDAIRHLEIELEELEVDVRLGVSFDPAAVGRAEGDGERDGAVTVRLRHGGSHPAPDVELTVDAIVLATGAVPVHPDVPGLAGTSTIDVREALEGTAEVGPRVVIVDETGTFAAASAAQMLADTGRSVTVVTPLGAAGARLGPPDRQIQMETLFTHGVDLIPAHRLTAVQGPTLRFAHVLEGTELTIEADTIILATGTVSDRSAFAGLDETVDRLHLVGDCVAPRDVGMAIYTAEQLGRSL